VPPEAVIPLHLADVIYPASHPLAGQTGVVLGFAVRSGDDVVLVDTGVGFGDAWIDDNYKPTRREVREALVAAGFDPTAVRTIVNSHLHFDHCGQNRAFPDVPIVVQRAELDAARGEGKPIQDWIDFPGATYRVVDGDTEVADGISVLATPGHTAGPPVSDGPDRRRSGVDRRPGRAGRTIVRDRRARSEPHASA